MEKKVLLEKYNILTKEILKENCKFNNTNEIVKNLEENIKNDPIATHIWTFDHFEHTKNINWEISEDVKDAKIILFCFGKAITNPEILAVRPRNIAIVELNNKFIISFLEAPQAPANEKIWKWINNLVK